MFSKPVCMEQKERLRENRRQEELGQSSWTGSIHAAESRRTTHTPRLNQRPSDARGEKQNKTNYMYFYIHDAIFTPEFGRT